MAKPNKVFERAMGGQGAISFRDFERLLLALGFKMTVQAGVTASTYIPKRPGPSACNRAGRMRNHIKYGSFAR